MGVIDERFALIRDGQRWYATRVKDRDTGDITFRVSLLATATSERTRDAHKKAVPLGDIAAVARCVLLEGKKMRCQRKGDKSYPSLHLRSNGVTGYELDPAIAKLLGVPASG